MERRLFVTSLGGGLVAATLGSAPARSQAQARSVLRFVPSSNLATLDPVMTNTYVSVCHGYAVFDTLFGVDSKQRVLPQMAEGATVSEDGLTWTVRLRDGLRFHDNEPVRAADCVASLSRWAVQQLPGRVILGYLDRWTATDDRTISIVLKRPLPSLSLILASAVFPPFMMPERIAKTDPAKPLLEMVGSGPFRFRADQYVSGSFAAYERFADYKPRPEPPDWTSGGKVAKVDRIEWRIIPDAATAVAALQAGEVDWVERPVADLLPVLKARKGITISRIDPIGWQAMLRLNHLHPPFDNKGVRQAVMAAIDQAELLRVATNNDPASYMVCKSLFPCGTPLGTEVGAAAMPGRIEAARALLQKSGYGGEKAVVLGATDIPPVGEFSQIIVDAMQKIGMNVELIATDWGTATQRRASKAPVAQGGWSAYVSSWNSPSLMNPAMNVFVRGEGTRGFFGWVDNPDLETMARQWLEADSDAGRLAIADKLQAAAFDTVTGVPLGWFVRPTAHLSTIKGILEGPAMLSWNVSKG